MLLLYNDVSLVMCIKLRLRMGGGMSFQHREAANLNEPRNAQVRCFGVEKNKSASALLSAEAQCERDSLDVEYSTKTKIENSMRSFILQKSQFNQEVNTANAKATLAYELQSSKIKQQLRNEEKQIDVVERQKQIEIEDQEILRREEELKTTVRLPAEAEAYSLLTIAEGIRTGTIESAKADAEYMKIVGLAEAEAARLVGCAAADQLLARANAYKLYGDAAVRLRVLETLPKIAAEVSAPLARTDEIVVVGDSGASGEVARLAGSLPPALKALTGLDLAHVLRRMHGAETADKVQE